MFKHLLVVTIAGLVAGAASAADMAAKPATPDNIAAAIADPARPDADKGRDANRKPAEVLAFAGLKAGESVLEISPGGGYFLRIFSKAIGPGGKLFELIPPPPPPGATLPPDMQTRIDAFNAMIKSYANVVTITQPFDSFSVPAKVDLAWTSDNYHDFHNAPNMDIAKFNKAVFNALKPGGIFIVLDHSAAAGAGLGVTKTLHRIDEASVKQEVEAAGFRLIAESDALHNPADPRTVAVFDPSVRGKTDQFVLKFQKPAN